MNVVCIDNNDRLDKKYYDNCYIQDSNSYPYKQELIKKQIFDEEDEYCPGCDNHYYLPAETDEKDLIKEIY